MARDLASAYTRKTFWFFIQPPGPSQGGWSRKRGMVGARGFEPPTPASRTRCATRLRYAPIAPVASLHTPSAQRLELQAVRFRDPFTGHLALGHIDALGQARIASNRLFHTG